MVARPRFVASVVFLVVTCLQALVTEGDVNVDTCLRRHNEIRAKHGVPPLAWEPYFAKHAEKWARNLTKTGGNLRHDPQKTYGEREGENLFKAGNGVPATCEAALEFWYKGLDKYRAAGACENPQEYNPPGTEQFTQMVWMFTERIGLAIVGDIVVARYHPPGNFPGEFAIDVKC